MDKYKNAYWSLGPRARERMSVEEWVCVCVWVPQQMKLKMTLFRLRRCHSNNNNTEISPLWTAFMHTQLQHFRIGRERERQKNQQHIKSLYYISSRKNWKKSLFSFSSSGSQNKREEKNICENIKIAKNNNTNEMPHLHTDGIVKTEPWDEWTK